MALVETGNTEFWICINRNNCCWALAKSKLEMTNLCKFPGRVQPVLLAACFVHVMECVVAHFAVNRTTTATSSQSVCGMPKWHAHDFCISPAKTSRNYSIFEGKLSKIYIICMNCPDSIQQTGSSSHLGRGICEWNSALESAMHQR